MIEVFQIALFISMFCIGLRIITNPGMIGNFLRKRYDLNTRDITNMEGNIRTLDEDIHNHKAVYDKIALDGWADGKEISKADSGRMMVINVHVDNQWLERARVMALLVPMKKRNMVLKPIIGCGTCMASVWTLFWFIPAIYLSGTKLHVLFIIPVMFIVAAMNSIIMAVYEYLEEKRKCNCN